VKGEAIRRRIEATRRVWRRGGAHLAMVPEAVAPPGPPALPGGHLDLPFAHSALPSEPVIFRGWALFPDGLPTKVEVWLGDESLGRARLGGHRPDVHLATGMKAALVAQFEHVFDMGAWSGQDGQLSVTVRATGPGGERIELPPVSVRVERHALRGDAARVRRSPAPAQLRAPRRSLQRVPAGRPGLHPRVLAFTHQLDLGGAQLYLLDLLRGLREEGLDCTVVSPLDGVVREQLEELGVRVHISSPLPIGDPAHYASRVEELAAWAAHGRYDVALVNTVLAFWGAEVAELLGIPTVWAIHESYEPSTLWWMFGTSLHPDVRARAEAALAGAAVGLFEADATRGQYEPYIGADRCVTLPYGLDLTGLGAARASFDRAAARRERGLREDERVVICVGTVEPRKGQVPLVQAFGLVADRHPDARLVLIGGRDDLDTHVLERYVRECAPEGRVEVLRVLADTWPWYGLADLMVCASDVESLPRSVLEAMAWETPVVATAVFGLPELIEHGRTGWLCEPRDVRALADALDRALETPDAELREIGRAARERVEGRHELGRYASACARLLAEAATGERVAVAGERGE
jgi:glycosyltransferase involved in cell wall biosynthesis